MGLVLVFKKLSLPSPISNSISFKFVKKFQKQMSSVDQIPTAPSTRPVNNSSAKTLASCGERSVARTPFAELNNTDPFASALMDGEVTRKKTVSDVSNIAIKIKLS